MYDHFGGADRFPKISDELMRAVDQADSAQYDVSEILEPTGWTLLNFLMDSRTVLGRFRDFRISNYQLMMQLIDACIDYQDVEEILALPDVAERVELFQAQAELFKAQLERVTTLHGDVAVLDLREEETIHAGNRFFVYALFPQAASRCTSCGAGPSSTPCSPSASRSWTAPPPSTSAPCAWSTRRRAPRRRHLPGPPRGLRAGPGRTRRQAPGALTPRLRPRRWAWTSTRERSDGDPGRGPVKSAERTVRILQALAQPPYVLSVAQLQERTGYPRSSLHALLRTLVDLHWIEPPAGPPVATASGPRPS